MKHQLGTSTEAWVLAEDFVVIIIIDESMNRIGPGPDTIITPN